MVSLYLRDEVLEEIMKVARHANDKLEKQGKKRDVTTGKVVARIVEEWYNAGMEAKQ